VYGGVNGDDSEDSEDVEETEGADDDDRTLKLNNEESGNECGDVLNRVPNARPHKKINFKVNDAMDPDIKSKRSFTDGYDLNTSLTTILSRENKHKTDDR